MLEETPLEAHGRVILSFTLPEEFLILFEPVSHTTHFFDVKGERTSQRQELIEHPSARDVLAHSQIAPVSRRATLKGIRDEVVIYEILPGAG